MQEQLLNYGGWAFLGILLVAIVMLMKAGYVYYRDRINNALDTNEPARGMTRKETIECFNQQHKLKEEAKVQGTPDQ